MRLLLALMVATSFTSMGSVITSVVAITSPQGDQTTCCQLINAINQLGLSVGYTSGVDDFASYTAVATHNGAGALNSGFTNSVANLPQIFTLNLGSILSISSMAYWGADNIGSVTAFSLYADSDSDFSNGATLLGSYTAHDINNSLAQIFTFGTVSTQYVQLVATQIVGNGDLYPGIGEVAFEASSIPEPSTWMLMGAGLAFAGWKRRRV